MKKRLVFLLVCLFVFSLVACSVAESHAEKSPPPTVDSDKVKAAVESFLQTEVKNLSATAQNGWQRFIAQQGVSEITFSLEKFDISAGKPLSVSFMLVSGQPDIKSQPKYGDNPVAWLEGVQKSILAFDSSFKINLVLVSKGDGYQVNYDEGEETFLQKTVEKLASKAPKTFADKTLLKAVVDYLMPSPFALGSKKPKDLSSLTVTPIFESFATRNHLVPTDPDPFGLEAISYVPQFLGIKGCSMDVSAGPENATISFTVPKLNDRTKAAMETLKELLPYLEDANQCSASELRTYLLGIMLKTMIDYQYTKGGDQDESYTFSLLSLPTDIQASTYYTHEQNGIVTDPTYFDDELTGFAAKLPDYPALPVPESGLIVGDSTGERITFKPVKDGYSRCISVYRVYDDELQAMVYINADKQASIRLPEGQYYCEIGIGKTWYGAKHRFADIGTYYTTEVFNIYHFTNHTYSLDDTFEDAAN